MNVQVLGKCSQCGGRVTCPSGPIGYAGNLEDLTRCESCGARKATGPVIQMEPAVDPFKGPDFDAALQRTRVMRAARNGGAP